MNFQNLPGRPGLILLAMMIGAAQLSHTLRFFRKLRRESKPRYPAYEPPVSVLIPVRDAPHGFADGVEALLAQQYDGRREFIFTAENERDPACAELDRILSSHTDVRTRLLFSNRAPEYCSAKLTNLLAALPHIDPGSEVLVFADSDLIVPPGWLRRLVAPLQDTNVGAATAGMIYIPCPGFWGFLRSVWMSAGMVYCCLMERATGQSLALRRGDFDAWGVVRVWEKSLAQDMPVTAIVGRQGKHVAFVSEAMPYAFEQCSASGFFQAFNRWVVCFRVYDKTFWFLGLLVTALKFWILLRSGLTGVWQPVACLFCLDAANLYLVFAVLRARFPEKFAAVPAQLRHYALLAALCAPLLWIIYGINFFNSLWCRTVLLGGRRYRIRGPQDVKVLNP